jgi:hypothetical protein
MGPALGLRQESRASTRSQGPAPGVKGQHQFQQSESTVKAHSQPRPWPLRCAAVVACRLQVTLTALSGSASWAEACCACCLWVLRQVLRRDVEARHPAVPQVPIRGCSHFQSEQVVAWHLTTEWWSTARKSESPDADQWDACCRYNVFSDTCMHAPALKRQGLSCRKLSWHACCA